MLKLEGDITGSSLSVLIRVFVIFIRNMIPSHPLLCVKYRFSKFLKFDYAIIEIHNINIKGKGADQRRGTL